MEVSSKIVNWKIICISLSLFVISIIVIFISYSVTLEEDNPWPIIVTEVASLIFVSSITALIFEIWLKRSFLDEILIKIQLKKDIDKTGIKCITKSFQKIKDDIWRNYIKSAREMDLFFCYAYTWRNSYSEEFNEFALKDGIKLRVVFPNPDSDIAINSLAERFSYEDVHIRERINNAIAFFQRLRDSNNADIRIWVIDEPPLYSLYRFDNEMVIATFKHRKQKEISVPAFICDNSGTLFQFYQEEFNDLMNRGTEKT